MAIGDKHEERALTLPTVGTAAENSVTKRLWSVRSDIRAVFSSDGNPVDGLRGISILMVVLFHCFFILKVALPASAFADFVSELPSFIRIGFNFDKAVDIFFVISGYLIGTALLKEKEVTGSVALRSFYRRRFFRIAPLFWVALLLYGSFAWKGDWQSLVGSLLFVENLFPNLTKIVPVGWSLAIEVQFYVLIPFLFLLSLRVAFRVLWVILALSISIRLGLLLLNPDFYRVSPLAYLTGGIPGAALLDTLYYPTWSRLSPIVLGLIIPFMARFHSARLISLRTALRTVAYLCLGIGFLFPSYASLEINFPTLQLIGLTIDRALVGLSIAIFILYWELAPLHRKSIAQRLLSHWALTMWGRLVFPVYLFHLPTVALAFLVAFGTTKPAMIKVASLSHLILAFPLSLLITLPFALLLHALIERPLIRIGKR